MTREEQDKLWADLSEESREAMRAKYSLFSSIDNPQNRGFCQGMANVFGKHNLQPSLTYEDVARELFEGKSVYYGIANGEVQLETNSYNRLTDYDLCTSERQVLKNQAINQLLNVAKFLNKNEDGSDWKPDFSDENNEFYTLGIDPDDNSVRIIEVNMQRVPTEFVYFRTEELALQAIQILGEDVIRTALTTDY